MANSSLTGNQPSAQVWVDEAYYVSPEFYRTRNAPDMLGNGLNWQTKIWEMPPVTRWVTVEREDGASIDPVPNAELNEKIADIVRTLPTFVENITRALALRDEAIEILIKRVDTLSDRIVDLEQKLDLLVAIEKNETFGMF